LSSLCEVVPNLPSQTITIDRTSTAGMRTTSKGEWRSKGEQESHYVYRNQHETTN